MITCRNCSFLNSRIFLSFFLFQRDLILTRSSGMLMSVNVQLNVCECVEDFREEKCTAFLLAQAQWPQCFAFEVVTTPALFILLYRYAFLLYGTLNP